MVHPLEVFARDVQFHAIMGTDCQQNCFVPLLLKRLKGQAVLAYGTVQPYLDAKPFYPLDFLLKHRIGQAILRNAYRHHPASHR